MAFVRLMVILMGLMSLQASAGSAFWVWNRSTPLSAKEREILKNEGISELFWQFGEMNNRDGQWRWKKHLPHLPEPTTPTLRIVPVVRLESSIPAPFESTARIHLKQQLVTTLTPLGADEWQLDYDATDRLLESYAAFLATLRPIAPKLSSTALAGWARHPAFSQLCANIDELYPMFYDLKPDTVETLTPVADPIGTAAFMRDWNERCSIPWRAGLPWFTRLTIYDTTGRSRGQLRLWSWDDVIFQRKLGLARPPVAGIIAFNVKESFTLNNRSVKTGEIIVARRPDPKALANMETSTIKNPVYFRLPDPNLNSDGSLAGFTNRHHLESYQLSASYTGDQLILKNTGPGDLPARVTGDGEMDRGYALEIDTHSAVFREAEAGEFFRVVCHRTSDTAKPKSVPTTFATRITFWFSSLPAGQSLKSGLFQLAPNSSPNSVKYRILNSNSNLTWTTLTPTN